MLSCGRRTYIQAPAPLAAEVALSGMMMKARIKRLGSAQIFVCPCLCTPQWLRHSYKVADIVFKVPVDSKVWPAEIHGPLLIGVLFPFISANPWQLRGSFATSQGCTLWEGSRAKWTQAIFCTNFGNAVSTSKICRNLWCGSCYTSSNEPAFHIHPGNQPQTDSNDKDRMLSKWNPRKVDLIRFVSARNGDDLLVEFECCDYCVFTKLSDHEPTSEKNEQDAFAMGCGIRSVILDASWSRARGTVEANTTKVREGLGLSQSMGMKGPYKNPEPLRSSYDHCGSEVAIQIVVASLGKGRYSETYKQWDTIRKVRMCYSNQVRCPQEKQTHSPPGIGQHEWKALSKNPRQGCMRVSLVYQIF